MLYCLWDGAYKRTLAANQKDGSGFPLSLSEWSFTICLTPYNPLTVNKMCCLGGGGGGGVKVLLKYS